MRLQLLLIFFILVITFNCFTQDNLKFYHLTREDGLSQSTVNDILQDYEGFFWFCTDNGVNKWNGYDFIHYVFNENNPNSLAFGRSSVIIQDKDSVIWIGSRQGGISKYIKEYDHFKVYQIHKGNALNNESGINYIVSMIPFRQNLLIATFDDGFHFFDKQKEIFQPVKLVLQNGEDAEIPVEPRIMLASDSTLWIAHVRGVLRVDEIRQDENGFTFTVSVFHQGNNVLTVYEDRNNEIWFGTLEEGAFRYNPRSDKISWLKQGKEDGKHLSHSIVRCFNEDKYGNLWIGTAGGGINIYNTLTGNIKYYTKQIGNKYSVGSNSIYRIYLAPDSNMWVGTYNRGVSYTNWYKQSFNHIKSFGAKDDLNNNSILSISEAPDHKIWLGTDGGGINILNPETNQHSVFSFPGNPDINVVKSLAQDSKGNMFIGTYRNGLFVYNYYSGKVREITPVNLNCLDIWDIALSNNEEVVWLATLGEGLIKFNRSSDSVTHFKKSTDSLHSLSHDYLSVVYVDSEDNVWIGSFNGGISMLPHGKGNEFINYFADTISNLGSNEVFAIKEDAKGNILVGTHDGGLNILNKETNVFRMYRADSVFPGNTVEGIIEDNEGCIWISSDVGITKLKIFSPDSVVRINHYAHESLLSNEFNQHCTFKSSNGKLFFGGMNGYNSFYPEDIPFVNKVGETIITNVYVFDKKLNFNSDSILKHKRSGRIAFDSWQSTLSFEFALLDYTISELNTYEYRLIGFDKEWNSAGNRRRATYTNIDPGKYTFEVRGINGQGIKDETPQRFSFSIKTPFYKTILFEIIAVVFVLFLILSIYRIRMRIFVRHEELLKQMVNERTQELQNLNKVLENQNEEINKQSNELKGKQTELIAANKELQSSYGKIEIQNQELENHRNNLEAIVKKRTIELENAKYKAEESEQLKMAFLSNMSHEIRTPMNAIVGFASLLADDDVSTEERKEYIKQVNTNSESLLILIDDILDLSKIEANQLIINDSLFELNQFVAELFYNWQHLHIRKQSNINIAYTNKLKNKEIYINSDGIRIRQIINNLLDNAFKFTHEGEVKLQLSMKDKNILISVKDTGIGISQEDIIQIFNRFRKGEVKGKKLYRGAGLGLTISNKLATMLGGTLSVVSQQNVGSTFTLSLPTSLVVRDLEKKPLKSASIIAKSHYLPPINILVVEDEETNYLYLKGMLERRKASVEWAKNGLEALELVTHNKYDLILMDIKMPVMDGVEATKRIKALFPNQVIFAQTAFARSEEEAEFRQAGFDEYITKPIQSELFFKTALKYFYNKKD